MNLVETAREIERHIFSALLGVLFAVGAVRLLLLVTQIDTWGLIGILAGGAAAGGLVSYFSQPSHQAIFVWLQSYLPQLRAWCAKSIFWLLGTAAVIGVLTVLVSGNDTLERVASTVLVSAVATGLLWPLSYLLHDHKTLATGLLGVVSVLVIFLLTIPLIWELDRIDDEMWMTSLAIGATTPWGMIMLQLLQVPRVRVAARIGMGLYAVLLSIFLVAAWHPGGWPIRHEWSTFGSWLALYGALSVGCLVGWVPWQWRDWRWLGVTANALAMSIWLWAEGSEIEQRAVILLTSLGIVVAHTSLSLLVPLRGRQAWVRSGATFALILAAFFLNVELLFVTSRYRITLFGRIAAASAIVACCGSLALIILPHWNRWRYRVETPGDLRVVKLVCPQCGKSQTLPLNGGQCKRCGLSIVVQVTRPAAKAAQDRYSQ